MAFVEEHPSPPGSPRRVRGATAEGGVRVLTLSRPEVHNALDLATIEDLVAELDRAATEPGVRAIVLTGDGASFCSGDDLRDARSASTEEFAAVIDALQRLTRGIVDSPLPVVACLNGPAYGAGLELALACDVRIAVDTFVCSTPEVRLGLVATNGASLFLPLIVGPSRARQMLLSGREFDAGWCLAAGLVDRLVSSGELAQVAREVAVEMSLGGPDATAATRRLLNAPLAGALRDALDAEAASCVAARESDEAREGMRAFFGRRGPRWAR